ncbi:MAG TPA: hypothetical protein VGR24_10415 [bacterium]|jgi:hypothetical protein|nr:hypothetical protein [bacterium]
MVEPASAQGRADPALSQRGLLPSAGAFRWASRASSPVWFRQTTRFQALRQQFRRRGLGAPGIAGAPPVPSVVMSMKMFNKDTLPLPQNETTIAIDPTDGRRIVGGYNDYRGLVTDNFTGWTASRDRGSSILRDGQIPPTTVLGVLVPSQGDPVVAADQDGNFFMGSFHFDGDDFNPNGITISKSPKAGSANGVFSPACSGGADNDCWPIRKPVTQNNCTASSGFFDDKPYIAVDRSVVGIGTPGSVYVVWTRFPCASGDFSSSILIAKCRPNLAACTAPVTLETTPGTGSAFDFVQLSHIVVAPTGKVYVTWVKHDGDGPLTQTARIRYQLIYPTADPASIGTLEPRRTVATESMPIPWGTAPYPANYRSATYPHVAVFGARRSIIVWDRRTTKDVLFDFWWFDYGTGGSIVSRTTDNDGATFSALKVISSAWGHQSQPSVCGNFDSGHVIVAYYSNENDLTWSHSQDVYVATSVTGDPPYAATRVTLVSNDTEADPLLSDFFIGDYLEVACQGDFAYVHYTANYAAKSAALLGGAFPIRQQDNFLARITLP